MKTKELKTLRGKSQKELNKLASKKKLKLTEELASLKVGGKKSPKKARGLKRDIAQILTIIREKELVEELASVEKKSSKNSNSNRSK